MTLEPPLIPGNAMNSLLRLQRQFRTALLGDADAPPLPEILGGAVDPAARLDIYRNNVIGNLTGALRLTYPAIERLVGAEFFAAACARYIAATPPGSADLYEYGADFSDFLAGFEPARELAYLPDVARLEWAVNQALHASRAPAIDAAALADLPAEAQADLRFTAHPTLSLLTLTHPAGAIWEAVLTADPDERDAALAAVDPAAGGETLAVLRAADALELVRLSPEAFALARALVDGQPLADALDLVAPDVAVALFGGLLTQGFFSGILTQPAPLPIE